MSCIRNILLLSVLLWPFTVRAQPLLVTEHNWTFQAGNGRYGLLQSNIAPGNLNRRTTVYCGGPLLTVSLRAEVLLALVLVPLGLLCAVLMHSPQRLVGFMSRRRLSDR